MVSLREFRRWQKLNPNFMTPKIVKLLKKGNIIIEISKGLGILNEPIFGITKVCHQNGEFKIVHDGSNKMKHSLNEAIEYAKKLLRDIKTLKSTKSSYYTGYADLDKQLGELYTKQIEIEKDLSLFKCKVGDKRKACIELTENHRKTIASQDFLLKVGKQRDSEKEAEKEKEKRKPPANMPNFVCKRRSEC